VALKIKPKIGVVSCSGECCSLGTVSRVATRMVLENLAVGETVTLCLPLFLAGDSGERMFAEKFHTVSVDGCHKLCAKKAIDMHSGETAASVDVEKLLNSWGEEPPASRRELNVKDQAQSYRVALEITREIKAVQEAQDG
jgi:uncharacterized metal-binding protein